MSVVRIFRVANFITKSNFKISSCLTQRAYSRVSEVNKSNSKHQLKVLQIFKENKCSFHTSKCRPIPPGLAIILKPLIRISALLFGRIIKLWYRRQSPEDKERIKDWVREKKHFFFGFLGLYFSFVFLYYLTHLEYNPYTKRRQFIVLNKEQQEKFSRMVYKVHLQELKQASLVPKTHVLYNEVLRTTAKLINANKNSPGFKDKRWTLTLVDSALENAYVLPGGNIFVFVGLLKSVENYDQLAIVLSHEMAHDVLNHSFENISRGIITDLILAIPIAILWATFPDLIAGILYVLSWTLIDIFHSLPYSRSLEMEADYVGLLTAAAACVDVREAVVFWGTMRVMEKFKGEFNPGQVTWLSTHPSHGDREKRINKLLPEAFNYQYEAGCPALIKEDPRKSFYKLTDKEIAARLKRNSILKI